MPIKRCVGPILYDDLNRVFLMTSEKWKGVWVVPGGKVEEGETEEEALRREMREELGIEIDRIEKVGEKRKPAGSDFHKPDMEFHFIDFFAHALSTQVKPNSEIVEYGWFSVEEALKLPLLDTTRAFVEQWQTRLSRV